MPWAELGCKIYDRENGDWQRNGLVGQFIVHFKHPTQHQRQRKCHALIFSQSHTASFDVNMRWLYFNDSIFPSGHFKYDAQLIHIFVSHISFHCQILKKKGSSSFLQRLERCGPVTVAVQLRVRTIPLHSPHICSFCKTWSGLILKKVSKP